MSRDDPFEDELRLQFSMIDTPAPSERFVERTVRRYRSWRLRRRLAIAAPGFALAASLGVVFGLSGVSGPGSGGSSSPNAIQLSDHGAIHLANYVFPLPRGFHVTAAATGACNAIAILRSHTLPPKDATGTVAWTPKTVPQSYSTVNLAAAATESGGCVQMALTNPFTPAAATQNSYLPFTGSSSSVRQVDVDGYVGWLTTGSTSWGKPAPQLTVVLPQGNGQMRDLAVGSSGLRASELLTIVSQGLS